MDGIKINGQLHWVSKPEDFADLIDKYMGYESAKYFDSILTEWYSALDTVNYYEGEEDELAEYAQKCDDLECENERLKRRVEELEDRLDNPKLQN